MLRGLGYFRGIDCPSEEKCDRPYCHFRHLNVEAKCKKTINLETVTKAINTLKNQISDQTGASSDLSGSCPSDSTESVGTSNEYVPYQPYKSASDLYEKFNRPASGSAIDYNALNTKRKKTVLHGAKGSSRNFNKNFHQKKQSSRSTLDYSLKCEDLPANDLEYDPLCNFNVPDVSEKLKQNTTDEALGLSSVATADKDENMVDLPNDLKDEEEQDAESKGQIGPMHCDKSLDARLESEQQVTMSKSVRTGDCVNTQAKHEGRRPTLDSCATNRSSSMISSEQHKLPCSESASGKMDSIDIDLFGADSDSEDKTSFVSQNGTSTKTKSENLLKTQTKDSGAGIVASCNAGNDAAAKGKKQVHTKASKKRKISISDQAKDSKRSKTDIAPKKSLKKNQKALTTNKCTTHKLVKNKSALDRNKDKKVKSSKLKKSLKQRETSVGPANILEYIDEDEIKRLDQELNGTNAFDECLQIYQEGLAEEVKLKKSANSSREKKVEPSRSAAEIKPDVVAEVKKENPVAIPQKNKRTAHQSTLTSTSCLKRVPKKARRFTTPAQAMLQRLDIIKQEESEKLLRAAIAGYEAMSTKVSKSRVAHLPSSKLSSNSLALSKTHLLAKKSLQSTKSSNSDLSSVTYKKVKPFADLSRSSSSTTMQTTVTKGCDRVAHTVRGAVDGVERPKILPDRHSKVPTNIRQRYLTAFIDECLRIFSNDKAKAFQMAKAEETKCKERSKTKTIYLSLAASTVKKLRSMTSSIAGQRTPSESKKSGTSKSPIKVAFKTNCVRVARGSHTPVESGGKTTSSAKKRQRRNCQSGFSILPKDVVSEISREELYEKLCKYVLTEEQLQENGYPRPSDIPGTCMFMVEKKKLNKDPTKKVCARCGKEFVIYKSGHFARQDDECIHHWGRAYFTKVGSTWEKRYNCCQNPVGWEGCSVAETHVHQDNKLDCNGYIKTLVKSPTETNNPGMYSIDCEMAYTVVGLELTRVSVVDFDCEVVYDTFVKPRGKVLDYNTKWSGVTAEDMEGVTTTLRDVQAAFLTKFSSETILVGHSLESDLMALRLIHGTVIDTSVVFPHRLGPPYKRALRNLMSDYLGILIQNADDEGHDSAEDATACIKLIRWKLEEDMKLSK